MTLKEYRKEYYLRNRDRIRDQQRVYYQTYERSRGKVKESAAKWAEKNPLKKLYVAKKGRAKTNNIEFTILLEDIYFPEFCPILGIKLNYSVRTKDRKALSNSPSFDRIDPSLGYVKGNVQIVSMLANMMKSNATQENLLKFADWIYETYGDQVK